MRQFQLFTYPTLLSDQYSCKTGQPYTFFSTSSENLFYQRFELQNQNFDFETTKNLILLAWSIFSRGLTLQNYRIKNIFHENPVEVRSFDRTTIKLIYYACRMNLARPATPWEVLCRRTASNGRQLSYVVFA
jgi:hypothetical protein